MIIVRSERRLEVTVVMATVLATEVIGETPFII